ncbi:N-acetylglucosamine-6-phosphate deacetylase [Candidatus Poribacteria bacterium]
MDSVNGIRNGKIMTPEGVIENGSIRIEGKNIAAVGKVGDVELPEGAEVMDVAGKWVLPGFIDIHCHGAKGCDTMDGTLSDIETIAKYHAGGGTTAFLPTTASSSPEAILQALEAVREARRSGVDGAAVIGAHLEGPFFAYAKRGCHLPIYVRNPRPAEYDRMLEYADDIVSMTLAPEIDGAEALIKALVDNGIVVSLGHSDATYSQILEAIEWGASHVTHMYCAMSTIVKSGPARIIGMVESTLLLDELTTEVIADGKHLPPELVRMVLKAKGLDRVCATTDAMRGAGMPPGVYTFGPKDGQEAVVQDGMAVMPDRTGYASSVVRMNDLIRVLIGPVGLSLSDAVKMATIIPAGIIGVADKMGSLEAGKDANIVVADSDIGIHATIVEGRKVN